MKENRAAEEERGGSLSRASEKDHRQSVEGGREEGEGERERKRERKRGRKSEKECEGGAADTEEGP